MITENLSTLQIHKLTKEQYEREYDAGRIDEKAIYLTPDNDYSSVIDDIQRTSSSLIPKGTIIGSNADINSISYIKVGNYYCNSNATTTTLKNCPTNLAFMMQVYSPISTIIDNEGKAKWVYRLRKITDHKGNEWVQDVYAGSTATQFTYGEWKKILKDSDINGIIHDTTSKASVKNYGAIGDGVTDDTAAFKQALANNRLVYVPEGEYLISDTLVIRENCELELAQSAVLKFTQKFTQTDKNCITLLRLASLKGNHATICVPYEFSASVLYSSTEEDLKAVPDTNGDGSKVAENTTAVPPFTKWSPQWKMSRYVTDINICKTMGDTYKGTYAGFHYSKTGDTAGKAVSMVCADDGGEDYMWGVNMSGLRIAGAFEYGIYIENSGAAWNHDMRIEAAIDACKIGAYAKNCNTAHLNVTIQPRLANNGAAYAEHGIKLENCKAIDLSSSCIWDWYNYGDPDTLIAKHPDTYPNAHHLALIGECRGLVINDFHYYETAGDIRDLIYTDRQSNLEQMTILQEPITRYFRSKDSKPYFSDGFSEKQLTLKEDLDRHFNTDVVKKFTDKLALAVGSDGNIYGNGKGYKMGEYLNTDASLSGAQWYGTTGFIPCKKGDKIYANDLSFESGDDNCRIMLFDANFNLIYITNASTGKTFPLQVVRSTLLTGSKYYADYQKTDDGFTIQLGSTSELNNVAYARLTIYSSEWGAYPMIAVNEEIKYAVEGFLADGINVNGKYLVLNSPSGYAYKLTVSDSGALSCEQIDI